MSLLKTLVDRGLTKLADLAGKLPDNKIFHAYTITDGKTPYLTRVLGPRIFGVRPMLHKIHRADSDRELHNHPWEKAVSFVLMGRYREERLGHPLTNHWMRQDRWVDALNIIFKSDFHRIVEVEGPCWTLFLAGKRQEVDGVEWGFLDYNSEKSARLCKAYGGKRSRDLLKVIPWQVFIADKGNQRT